jgi:hypothetical protein
MDGALVEEGWIIGDVEAVFALPVHVRHYVAPTARYAALASGELGRPVRAELSQSRMALPRLFHFSEAGDIDAFDPKPVQVPTERKPGEEWLNGSLVWAVDELRQATYTFPRDCPRILLWLTDTTNEADREAWWGDRSCSMIAHVEWRWLDRIRDQVLFRYELPAETFLSTSDDWMWVSKQSVEPVAVERLDDLLGALRAQGVELRVMESLGPLRAVWDSSLHASGIRLRNAHDSLLA